jgi:hypothetical protein
MRPGSGLRLGVNSNLSPFGSTPPPPLYQPLAERFLGICAGGGSLHLQLRSIFYFIKKFLSIDVLSAFYHNIFIMSLFRFIDSQELFELPADSVDLSSPPLKRRIEALESVCKLLIALPFSFLAKGAISAGRLLSLCLSIIFLLATLGIAARTRDLFVRRMEYMGKDLADWVLYPFAALSAIIRLLGGGFIHPVFLLNL